MKLTGGVGEFLPNGLMPLTTSGMAMTRHRRKPAKQTATRRSLCPEILPPKRFTTRLGWPRAAISGGNDTASVAVAMVHFPREGMRRDHPNHRLRTARGQKANSAATGALVRLGRTSRD